MSVHTKRLYVKNENSTEEMPVTRERSHTVNVSEHVGAQEGEGDDGEGHGAVGQDLPRLQVQIWPAAGSYKYSIFHVKAGLSKGNLPQAFVTPQNMYKIDLKLS